MWFELWLADRESILNIMIKNMVSDLEAGYSYFGDSITKQRAEIEEFKSEMDERLMGFWEMTDKQVDRWCYFDLIKRGAIEP